MNRKYLPKAGNIAALASLSCIMRITIELAIDLPNAANASWMCPLLGLALFAPFLFALRQAARLSKGSPWENIRQRLPRALRRVIEIDFALLLMLDAASMVRLAASSYNVQALNHVTVHLLIVPLGAVVAAAIFWGANAVGNSARIAIRFLAALMILLLCVQLPEYKPSYLAPIFGAGAAEIIIGSIACAGNMALLALIWLLALPDANQRGLTRNAVFSAICASLLLAALHAGYPSMPGKQFTRAARLELVLSNGRMSLAPQFLLNLLWYGGILYLIAAESCASACWLSYAFPKLSRGLCAALETILICMAAIFYPQWLQNQLPVTLNRFALIGAPFALALLTYFIRRKGNILCGD